MRKNTNLTEGGGDNSKNPFFSIIIPVYNTEKYIARCLDSCINQTFKDIEIIVVDDCGQDQAIQIAQEYAKRDSRITIIHNPENLGLFHTRIVGENKARGEYILHLDSDDYVNLSLCETVFKSVEKEKIDIVGFHGVQDTIKYSSPLSCNINTLSLSGWVIWNKAYRKDIITQTNLYIKKNLSFHKINMAEDMLKTFLISLFSESYIGIDRILYYYEWNEHSISKDFNDILKNKQRIRDFDLIIKIIKSIDLKNFEDYKKVRIILIHILENFKKNYTHIYYHSKAYENKPFAYPINFLKSLWYTRSPRVIAKTLARVFVYFMTLGRIKI